MVMSVASTSLTGWRVSVGTIIRSKRLSVGLTQEDLAEALSKDQNYVSFVETGRIKRPSREVLETIAKALSMTSEETSSLLRTADYAPDFHHIATDGELGTSGSVEFRVTRGTTVPGAPPPGATADQWEQFWLNYPGDPPEEAVAGIEAVRRRRKEALDGMGR